MTSPFASNLDTGPILRTYEVRYSDGSTVQVPGVGGYFVDGYGLAFHTDPNGADTAHTTLPLVTPGGAAVVAVDPLIEAEPVVPVVNAATATTAAQTAQTAATAAQTTASNAALAAAAAAQAAAAAKTTAEQAATNATTALTTANGKNAVTYSTAAPTAATPGKTTGDLWWRRTAAGLITGTWEWDGTAWQPRTFDDAVLTTITAAKITTGTLQAGTQVIAGATGENRLVLASTGLTGTWVDPATGTATTTLDYNVQTGVMDLRGVFRTLSDAERSVVIAANIGAWGATIAQPGILFRNPTSVNRWAQIYSTNSDLLLDGPAYTDTNGVAHLGASWRINIDGLYGYTSGTGASAAVAVANNGSWRFGHRPSAGGAGTSVQPAVSGDPAGTWYIGGDTEGTRLTGAANGLWTLGGIGTKATAPRVFANPDSTWYLGRDDTRVYSNPDGTWTLGHNVAQAVYSSGQRLVLRDRQVSKGGGIDAYVSAGSWFDVWPSDASDGTQGGMFVHGRFGATIKTFIIDHPTDPDRNLVHVATESPRAGVEYWDIATLNAKGEAVVELPHYFEALTHLEGRAVLVTPVGRPAPVGASEIVDGKFTVYGPAKGRVSWLVKAARKDPGASFVVEPLKAELRPDLVDGTNPAPLTSPDPVQPADPPAPREPKRTTPTPGGKHGRPL